MIKKILVFIIIVILGFTTFVRARVVAVFDEILKPNRICLDQEHIFITERTTIFIYSLSDFKLINKFGREGEGPGEFKIPLFIIPMADKLLINSLGKISFFSKQGILLNEIKSDGNSNYFFPLGKGFAGSTYTQERGLRYFTLNRFDSKLKKGMELVKEQIPIQQPGKIELFRRAFMHRTYKDRLYVTGKEGFVLDCISQTGELLYTIKRENFKRHKISSEDIKNADKYFKIRYGDSYEEIKERITYPGYFPEIRSFYLVDNKIYILPYEWKENALKFYIYTIEGKPLSEKFIPFALQYSMQPYPFAIQNDQLYQLIENESNEDWELHINKIKF